MYTTEDIRLHLDRIMGEVNELKRVMITLKIRNEERTEKAWEDLMLASVEISKMWKGPSAVDEIRNQRDKTW